jgi:hypothetical protein
MALKTMWAYLEQQDSVKPIVFLRIALSAFAICKIAVVYPYLPDVYGQYGYVQWAISKAGLYGFLPHMGDYYSAVSSMIPDSNQLLTMFFWLYVVTFLFLALGLFTRVAALLGFYLHLLWMDTGSGLMYGVDVFTQMALFYLLFMPAGNYFSLDVVLGLAEKKQFMVSAGVTRKLLQFQLLVVYMSSGIEKALGPQWWNGEAIWRSLMLPSFTQHNLAWLAHYPAVLIVSGWLVVSLEILYPVLLLLPRVRVVGLACIFMLHLFIGVFLGMWLFAAIMIILSFFAFGPQALADIRAYRLRRAEASQLVLPSQAY